MNEWPWLLLNHGVLGLTQPKSIPKYMLPTLHLAGIGYYRAVGNNW